MGVFNAQVDAVAEMLESEADYFLTQGMVPLAFAKAAAQTAAVVFGHHHRGMGSTDEQYRAAIAEFALRLIDEADRHRGECAAGNLPPALPEHLASRLTH